MNTTFLAYEGYISDCDRDFSATYGCAGGQWQPKALWVLLFHHLGKFAAAALLLLLLLRWARKSFGNDDS